MESPSKIEYVDAGLKELARVIKSMKLRSIAIPALGCGNGGLKWEDVKHLIQVHLEFIDADIFVYEPI
ncbi:MAG: macro domain-containing protein [Chitinophagaceae bacterium]|nr:macro domain-containing protein [Chitinophagaceae bacterium]